MPILGTFASASVRGFRRQVQTQPPLDGISGTISGAWSMSRQLLSSYGSAFYATSTGVSALNDQSGNSRNLTQGTGGAQPAVTTAGGSSRACAAFDGSDDYLAYATPSNLFSVGTKYVICTAMYDTIGTDSGTIRANDVIWGLYNRRAGVSARTTGPNAYAWNYTSSENAPTGQAIATGTVYCFEFRHESGTLYFRVNSGGEVSVASGNTDTIATDFRIASNDTPVFSDIKLFEIVTFSAAPSSGDRNTLAANMLAWAQ